MQFKKRKALVKSELFRFLKVMDKESRKPTKRKPTNKPTNITAVGGTAMTLLDLKTSTIDIDFDFRNDKDRKGFKKTLEGIPHGFKIDSFVGGFIFSQQLPKDYFEKSIRIPHRFKNIRLYALHPLDIVLSKIGRLDERDREDIKSCIEEYKLKKSQIRKRAKLVKYVGHEESYQINLQYVLKNFFR
jgi:hypothetical protein